MRESNWDISGEGKWENRKTGETIEFKTRDGCVEVWLYGKDDDRGQMMARGGDFERARGKAILVANLHEEKSWWDR